jgi:phosphoadenosine phosphosulfate reductase
MRDLFDGKDHVERTIERLRAYEPTEGYWLGFSGGKDSITLLRLAEMSGAKFEAHFSLATVDPPEIVRFVRQVYPQVACDRPPKSMFTLIIEHGTPPTRMFRFCCEDLKERGGSGHVVLTGIRWQESVRRKARKMVETCFRDATKTYLHPIIDWTEAEVWEFIHREGLPVPALYSEGWKRIGCVMCPMSGRRGMARDMVRWPRIANMYHLACEAVYQRRRERGDKMIWTSGEDMFNWWISGGRGNTVNAEQEVFVYE